MNSIQNSLQYKFEQHGDAAIARQQATYMKNICTFAGVKTPLRKELQKIVFAQFIPKTSDELIVNAQQLWNSPYREMQYSALEYLEKHKKLFIPQLFKVLEKMSEQTPWWDTIDSLASRLFGPLLKEFPQLLSNIDTWKNGNDMWKHRIAILFQLKYKNNTDIARLLDTILIYTQRTYTNPFWINKAAGWALREYSKTNPQAVRIFLNNHQKKLSSLTKKEAAKYI